MKKRLTSILAMLLATVLLCGSAAPKKIIGHPDETAAEETETRDITPGELCRFDEMPYARPALAPFRAAANKLIDALKSGAGFRKTVSMLDELFTLYYSADTMSTIADIRNSQDLTDAYYAEEYAACLDILTEMSQIMEQVYLACGESKHGARLERDYFGPGFLQEYGPEAEETLTEEYIALVEKENELISRYRALTAEPTVELNGREKPVWDAVYDAQTDREVEEIYDAYYKKYNGILGQLYLELLSVRKAQAEALGYGSYPEMMYEIGFDRDFSLEEGRAFLDYVKKWILPLYDRCMDDELYWQLMEDYVGERDLFRALEAVASGLGGEVAEAYDFMRRYELCDLSMRDVKAEMSYQSYLTDYDAPFLFVYPYGDLDDYISVTHEFGHYVEAYVSYGAYRSVDLAEVFSQAMQFLSLDELREALGQKRFMELRYLNLYDLLDTFASQSAYAEFEERACELENPNVEDLNALYRQLMNEYGFDESTLLYGGLDWIDVTHFFEQPFYVVSYPVSACCALEIYESELGEKGAGLAQFMRLVDAEEIGVVGAAAEAGLKNPLTEARVQEVAAFLEEQFAA